MEDIYFIENILSAPRGEESNPGMLKTQNDNECTVILFNASKFLENEQLDNSDYFNIQTIPISQLDDVKQGTFVYNTNLSQNVYTRVARHFVSQNNMLRRTLINNTAQDIYEPKIDRNIVSYHVNVGHGNCSFLVDKSKKDIWLIDCSNFDYLEHKSYQKNIDSCITHIKDKYCLQKFHIEKVFITHPHFDHYSGIGILINKGFIDADSFFYINNYYTFASGKWNDLLAKIAALKPKKVIEPIFQNSFSGVDILYPEQSVVRTLATKGSTSKTIIQSNPNNASIVFLVKDINKSFLFTGDIETEAWDIVKKCCPHLLNCDYYAISHHGSDTGHKRTKCPMGKSISKVSDCIKHNAQPILMGRDGAYSGIYSTKVLSDFKNIIYSQQDASGIPKDFVEIEWELNNVKYH
ncbi:hypothetical protein AGMMS50212_05750 [Spirochaetia bacterium]|nr:hypothetical protein AGMMS50212_05750 [Spirochaetia bacterium]